MSAEIFSYSIATPSRAAGFNAVVHAAYVSGEKLHDETENRTYSMGAKDRIVHTEIAIPMDSPAWVREVARTEDRERLWNMAEAAERRADAQVYRRVILALDDGIFVTGKDHQLDVQRSIEMQTRLVREHVERSFTSQGMIADWAIHWDKELKNPHAHVILTRRLATEEGFSKWKDGQAQAASRKEPPKRPWNDRHNAERWREDWAKTQNRALEELGLPYRLDHRSYERRGIDLEPTDKHFGQEEKQEENRKLREAEADRLIGNPRPLFDLMSQSFVADLQEKDLEHYATRFAPEGDEARRAALLNAVKESKELIALPDGKYTTQGIVAKQAREQLKDVLGRVAEAKDWAELDRVLAEKGWRIEQAERRGKVVYDLAKADDPVRRTSAFRVDEQLGPKALERLGERPIERKPEQVIDEPAPPAGDDREKKGDPPKKGEAAPPEVPGAAADTKDPTLGGKDAAGADAPGTKGNDREPSADRLADRNDRAPEQSWPYDSKQFRDVKARPDWLEKIERPQLQVLEFESVEAGLAQLRLMETVATKFKLERNFDRAKTAQMACVQVATSLVQRPDYLAFSGEPEQREACRYAEKYLFREDQERLRAARAVPELPVIEAAAPRPAEPEETGYQAKPAFAEPPSPPEAKEAPAPQQPLNKEDELREAMRELTKRYHPRYDRDSEHPIPGEKPMRQPPEAKDAPAPQQPLSEEEALRAAMRALTERYHPRYARDSESPVPEEEPKQQPPEPGDSGYQANPTFTEPPTPPEAKEAPAPQQPLSEEDALREAMRDLTKRYHPRYARDSESSIPGEKPKRQPPKSKDDWQERDLEDQL